MSVDEEKQFLLKEINGYEFDNDYYQLRLASDHSKIIFGIYSQHDDKISKIVKCRNVFLSIKSMQKAIRYSLQQAMYYSYHEKVNSFDNFQFISEWYASDEEFLAYYFLDNAIFRVSSLWDMLAQLYNIIYDIGKDVHGINYHNFFKNNKDTYQEFQKIYEYFEEDEPEDIKYQSDAIWKGNHQFLKDYRNMQTHIRTQSLTGMSNLDFNIKTHPLIILKRTTDEFYSVCGFIDEALQKDIKD